MPDVILPEIAAQSAGGAVTGAAPADAASKNNAVMVAAAMLDACDMHAAAEAAGLNPPDNITSFDLAAWQAFYDDPS